MLQLRILNGHHKGAILNLDEAQQVRYNLGCDDYSDLLVVDIGIEKTHLTCFYENHQWWIETNHEVKEENGCFVIGKQLVKLYQRLYLAGIWIGFADEQDTWATLEPLPSSTFDAQNNLNIHDFLNQVQEIQESNAPKVMIETHHAQQTFSRRSKMLAILALLSLTGWATANVFLEDPLAGSVNQKAQQAQKLQQANAHKLGSTMSEKNQYAVYGMYGNDGLESGVQKVKQNYNRKELAKLLDDQLIKIDLKEKVSYDFSPDGWFLEVSLDDEDRMRLERMVEQFNQNYQPKFAITIRNVSPKNALAIKVNQVILGKLAGIVTDDGQRLYVGDTTTTGYVLKSVSINKVTFDGRGEHIEIQP